MAHLHARQGGRDDRPRGFGQHLAHRHAGGDGDRERRDGGYEPRHKADQGAAAGQRNLPVYLRVGHTPLCGLRRCRTDEQERPGVRPRPLFPQRQGDPLDFAYAGRLSALCADGRRQTRRTGRRGCRGCGARAHVRHCGDERPARDDRARRRQQRGGSRLEGRVHAHLDREQHARIGTGRLPHQGIRHA